jgi:hypothetical protein
VHYLLPGHYFISLVFYGKFARIYDRIPWTCDVFIDSSLNRGCSFITLREPCNNQRPRCDISWLYVTHHLYHGFFFELNGYAIERK